MGDDMFTVFRGGLNWGNDNKLLLLLWIGQWSSLTPLEGLTEKGGLIEFAAGRSPMRRIDHQLVEYWPSKCWQLTASDVSGCRYTSSLSLLLSVSISFCLHSPSFISSFLSPDTCYHNRFTTYKKQKALSFISDQYFNPYNCILSLCSIVSKCSASFLFLSWFKDEVFSMEMGVCCVYGTVFCVCVC